VNGIVKSPARWPYSIRVKLQRWHGVVFSGLGTQSVPCVCCGLVSDDNQNLVSKMKAARYKWMDQYVVLDVGVYSGLHGPLGL